MATTLAVLLIFAAVAGFWSAHRAAAEAAIGFGRNACAAADVQWLDQTVQFAGLRLRRGGNGWLRVERRYHFDYSRDGEDRRRGRIVLLGTELQELAGPAPRDDEGGGNILHPTARTGTWGAISRS
ncbi:DUF3301 domain-containing protein [Coralloluteibacterium stylophorae]|uniref:DUF3301 domain-containing protein n=1 Tax=Coralloluteibacterium stylophorae TaxID=1776034 RepID=A0A8J8B0Q6_9GAMM|nr:DUF3301 domain-containing protein [Coralloluteibacterium stylophorae]MBS7456675.1 DUF3301 domain-containing protein [Coralloluteibacterium stylophorae]